MSSSLLQMNTHSLSILSRFYFYEIEIVKILLKSTLLSILSRFYFYNVHTNNIRIRTYLSILSRFYFYLTIRLNLDLAQTFNPIKVLFLLNVFCRVASVICLSILSRFYFYLYCFRSSFWNILFFQSYQGSIFTVIEKYTNTSHSIFQSYQGSIFTIDQTFTLVTYSVFQSYQGSIFTLL